VYDNVQANEQQPLPFSKNIRLNYFVVDY